MKIYSLSESGDYDTMLLPMFTVLRIQLPDSFVYSCKSGPLSNISPCPHPQVPVTAILRFRFL